MLLLEPHFTLLQASTLLLRTICFSYAAESLDKSQRLGETGDVDASMLAAQQAETYKKQYDDLHRRLTAPDRTMTVCEICGLFINSSDNDQRRLVREEVVL